MFTYRRAELPYTPEVQAALAQFLACNLELYEALDRNHLTGHYLYNWRGVQNLRLSDLPVAYQTSPGNLVSGFY